MGKIETFERPPTDHAMAPRNRFKVPMKKWNRWASLARATFNSVFMEMKDSQKFYLHPKALEAPNMYWRTTAWNAAWIAADNVQETLTEWANAK